HEDVLRRGPFKGHPLTGPVAVRGARPGDTLVVEILDVQPALDWGWTAIRPGRGLLPEADFAKPFLHVWDLSDKRHARMGSRVAVPLAPFPGVLGVALDEPGAHSTMPPRRAGGNMDIKQLVAGPTLWLPVLVENALFSVGDARAEPGAGLRRLLGGRRPQDQRDRRRAKLDRVRVPARVDLHLSAAMAADLDAIAPLRAWLREWQARVRTVDFEGGRTMCASEIVAFGTVAPMVEGIDAVMDAQWHQVWGNIPDLTAHADPARGAIPADRGWPPTPWDAPGTRSASTSWPARSSSAASSRCGCPSTPTFPPAGAARSPAASHCPRSTSTRWIRSSR